MHFPIQLCCVALLVDISRMMSLDWGRAQSESPCRRRENMLRYHSDFFIPCHPQCEDSTRGGTLEKFSDSNHLPWKFWRLQSVKIRGSLVKRILCESLVETRDPGATWASRSGENALCFLKHLLPPVELHKYETPSTDQLAASLLFFFWQRWDFAGNSVVSVLLLEGVLWIFFFLCEVFCATLWSYIWFPAIFCQFAALPTSSQCLQLLAPSPSSLAQTAPWH